MKLTLTLSGLRFLTLNFFLLWILVQSLPVCASEPVPESASESNRVDIYVHQNVPLHNYTLGDIRAYFAMKKRYWPNGDKVQVFVLPDANPLHRLFTRRLLNMFPHQFRRIWDRLIFSGVGHAPVEVKSVQDMREKISTTPGAIGYLDGTEPVLSDARIRRLFYE
jgi:hypothetical protein